MVMILVLALSVASTQDPEAEVAALYGEPDVYAFSYLQYAEQGMNNFEQKMLVCVYLDSLESALDSLYLELRDMYALAPEFLEYLDASHEAFLEYSDSWARLCEERIWWDAAEGVREDGSFRGYVFAGTLSLYWWQKIVAYTRILRFESNWDEAPDLGRLGITDVGGYYP